MKILLTGGAGFIGSHLAKKLVERDDDVVVIDNFDNFYDPQEKRRNLRDLSSFPNFFLEEGNIEDVNFLNEIFKKYKFDKIVHLAAKAGVRSSVLDPQSYFQTNVTGTINLLEIAKNYHVKNVIFGSSSTAYGESSKVPFSEKEQNLFPTSPYGVSKLTAEKVCFTYHRLYGLNFSILRFFSVYGPGQRPDLAVRKFIDKIIDGKKIEIFGRGEFQRDFTYIDDIVDGILRVVDKNFKFEIFNLGNFKPLSVLHLIELIEKLTNKKAIKVFKKVNLADVKTTYANIQKAKKVLGYKPKVEFRDGLQSQISWQKSLRDEKKFMPSEKIKKILVTGGAGFVGSHLVEKLVGLGYEVRVLDNFSSGKKENLELVLNKIKLIEGDITDQKITEESMNGVDAVFHLAASVSVPESVKDPNSASSVNVLGVVNLLQSALRFNTKKFIFSSSCAVYGHLEKQKVIESDLTTPLSVYGVSKLAAEEFCLLYQRLYKVPVVILRFFNIFGPRQPLKSNYAAVIPNFSRQMLENKSPIIYGDGNQTRDFIYIEDVVNALLLSLISKNSEGKIFNIGSGNSTSIKTIEKKMRKILDFKDRPLYQPERVFDIKNSCANVNLAKRVLNFEPSTPIDEGLEKTIKYFRTKKV